MFKDVWRAKYKATSWMKINLTFGSDYLEERILVQFVPDNRLVLALCDGTTSTYCEDEYSNWYINLYDDFLCSVARLNVHECTLLLEMGLLLNSVQFEFEEHRMLSVEMFRDIVIQFHGVVSYAVSTTWMANLNKRMLDDSSSSSSSVGDGGNGGNGGGAGDDDDGGGSNSIGNSDGGSSGSINFSEELFSSSTLSTSSSSNLDDDDGDDLFVDVGATEDVSSLLSRTACPSIDNSDNVLNIEGDSSFVMEYITLEPVYGTYIP
jgi:hypothetical protein